MTTLLEETIEERIDEDDLPTAHLPDDEGMTAILNGGRPTRALCGAPMLGITATPPFRRCEACDELADERGIRHA